MDDGEWFIMTILVIVLAIILFQGSTLFIRQGFKKIPVINGEASQKIDDQRKDFIENTRRQQDQMKKQMERSRDAYKRSRR